MLSLCRRESHQIWAIFNALLEALKTIIPQLAALFFAAASVTSAVCSAASIQ